jgi:Ulp1 family protease
MDKAFTNYEKEMIEHGKNTKQPFLDTSAPESTHTAPAASSTRQKLSSALQTSKDESSESKRVQSKPSTRDDSGSVDAAGDSREGLRKNDSGSGVEIPVKPFRPQESAERVNRFTPRRTTRLSERSAGPERTTDFNFDCQPSPKDDAARKKWKKPVVYPWVGKKKAEVSVEDRDRLREGEFLNDNLIGFYMRFLQDHLERTNKEAAKKVYFFNSYFFDTLLNTPKGDRSINYSGVEKWTRSVDLFSYDYIVVPINQAAHWYVAIICNLPSLELGSADPVQPSSAPVSDKETSNQPESDVHEILESPETEPTRAPTTPTQAGPEGKKRRNSESPISEGARQSFASMTIQEQEKARQVAEKPEAPADADEWPEGEENPTSPPARFSPLKLSPPLPATASHTARKTKKGKAGPKLSPTQTTIVTFDSLDLGRSPTIKMLREYICQEATSKRGVEVNPTAIKGMRARQIPLQPNYSDCGLYLLAYVEKFVQDPDSFIKKLLSREMDQVDDWPPLGSGLLRHRLRKFLDDLYDEQTQAKSMSEGQAIMADQQPISYLLGPPLPSQTDGTEQGNVKPPQSKDDAKKPAEKPAVENAAQESNESNGGPAADQLELVPTASTTGSDSSKGKQAPGPPGDRDVTPRPAPSKDEEVVEVPDSQETRQAPESKQSRAEKKKATNAEEAPTSRKSERKKASVPIDTDVVNVDEPISEKPARGSGVQVQVQVRRTPPPNEAEPVRKSPRGKTREN